VANVEQLFIVSSLADPPPRTGFIDRCLVAAYDADIAPVLCLTKVDLAGPEAVLAYYAELELPHVLLRPDRPLAELTSMLRDRLSVFVGHSGVGKSTLVNRLVPDADRAVGVVSAIGKGRHTSTSVVALAIPGGGWIVDTPGVRSFGIAHVDPDNVLHGFPELVDASANCPPNCDHVGAAGDCGLDAVVVAGRADPRRLASYRRLLASRTAAPDSRRS
jgi:ribosome biogenesis GTPase / thiamine phosphate phosphatase